MTKPKDSNILRGDGSFVSETVKGTEYTPKKGERYDTIRPGVSDIWKVSNFEFFFHIAQLIVSAKSGSVNL